MPNPRIEPSHFSNAAELIFEDERRAEAFRVEERVHRVRIGQRPRHEPDLVRVVRRGLLARDPARAILRHADERRQIPIPGDRQNEIAEGEFLYYQDVSRCRK